MQVVLCARKGGATVWVGDVQTVGEALDTYARTLGYADDLDRWADQGPHRLRVFAHTGLQLEEILNAD